MSVSTRLDRHADHRGEKGTTPLFRGGIRRLLSAFQSSKPVWTRPALKSNARTTPISVTTVLCRPQLACNCRLTAHLLGLDYPLRKQYHKPFEYEKAELEHSVGRFLQQPSLPDLLSPKTVLCRPQLACNCRLTVIVGRTIPPAMPSYAPCNCMAWPSPDGRYSSPIP